MTELPAPTAQGDLARTPFAHALLYCQQRELTGTLVVWPEDPAATPGQDRIRIERGVVVAARFAQRAGALDRGLLPLFARSAGPYAFYADVDLVGGGEAVRSGRVEIGVLLAASLRGPSRDDAVDSVLASFGDSAVRLRAGSDLRRFELLPKEAAFVEVIRAAPAPVADLAQQCELGETAGRRLLYLFAVTKHLEPWSATSAEPRATSPRVSPSPAASARAPTPSAAGMPAASGARAQARKKLELELPPDPPPGLSAEHTALWSEVARTLREMDRQSYFEMLGVPREAGADAVRKAYFGAVKKWHPDRVPAELAALKPFVERIFHQLTAAQDALCDEKKRGNYMRVLSDGGGTPESERKMGAVLQAAMDHQKAEVLIRRRDFAGAIELLEGAIAMSPDDADAHASLAWAMFHIDTGNARLPEMLAGVERAISLNPRSDRAHFYRGMMLRRAGRESEALAAFEQAASLNPKNIDAVREVRLAQMRGGAPTASAAQKSGTSARPPAKPGPAKESSSGLLSKLFGGKKDSSDQ